MADGDYLTIRQIAELAKREDPANIGRSWPRTMTGWKRRAREKGWDDYGPGVTRVVGGERVYHLSLLPGRLRKMLTPSPPPKPDMAALKALRAEEMTQARRRIVGAVETYCREHECSQRAAILALLDPVEKASKGRGPREVRQLDGFGLPYTTVRDAKESGKPWTVSQRCIEGWVAEAKGRGKAPTARRIGGPGRPTQELDRVLRFLAECHGSTRRFVIALLLAGQEAYLVDELRARGYCVEPPQLSRAKSAQTASAQSRR